jgi:hypothetical protein
MEVAVPRSIVVPIIVAIASTASLYGFDTEESVRKSMPVSSATHLRLTAEFASISVQPGTGRNVDVEVFFRGDPPSRREFDRMLRDFTLNVVQQGSEVGVNATFTRGWEPLLSFMIFDSPFFGNAICHNWRCLVYSSWLREVEFRITVPQQFDASLTTSGGSISVGGLKGEVVAHTSGGAIRVNDTAGNVDVSTSGGSISIQGVTGRVKAHTSGGGIDAREIAGAIDASTSGGPVRASLHGQPQHDCRLYTSGGSISVNLASDVHVILDASTSGGSISTDFPITVNDDRHPRELRGPLNGGGPLIHLHTSGGSITVRRAGAL